MFPRHVLEYMAVSSIAGQVPGVQLQPPTTELVDRLALSHTGVTIMFMDIVGEQRGARRLPGCKDGQGQGAPGNVPGPSEGQCPGCQEWELP